MTHKLTNRLYMPPRTFTHAYQIITFFTHPISVSFSFFSAGEVWLSGLKSYPHPNKKDPLLNNNTLIMGCQACVRNYLEVFIL